MIQVVIGGTEPNRDQVAAITCTTTHLVSSHQSLVRHATSTGIAGYLDRCLSPEVVQCSRWLPLSLTAFVFLQEKNRVAESQEVTQITQIRLSHQKSDTSQVKTRYTEAKSNFDRSKVKIR